MPPAFSPFPPPNVCYPSGWCEGWYIEPNHLNDVVVFPWQPEDLNQPYERSDIFYMSTAGSLNQNVTQKKLMLHCVRPNSWSPNSLLHTILKDSFVGPFFFPGGWKKCRWLNSNVSGPGLLEHPLITGPLPWNTRITALKSNELIPKSAIFTGSRWASFPRHHFGATELWPA